MRKHADDRLQAALDAAPRRGGQDGWIDRE